MITASRKNYYVADRHPTVVHSGPLLATGSRHLAQDLARRKVGLNMRVPTSTQPCHAGRWETIRYALDSNARTIRLCFILIVLVGSPILAAAVTGLLPYLLSRL
jgi:hypothetical protein